MSAEKKIIIDEDWKSQVQAEKEGTQEAAGESASAGRTAGPRGETADQPFPPASFDLLLTSLATETLVALGQIPHPATGKPRVHRHHAQYLIDTIDVLREKTQGNLTQTEQQTVEGLLHQLRMVFVQTAGEGAAEAKSTDKPSADGDL